MTDKEHELIVMMFTRQTLYVQVLADLLKSKGIIEGDDIPAFEDVARNTSEGRDLFFQVNQQYSAFAKAMGLELPTLPPSPASDDQPL